MVTCFGKGNGAKFVASEVVQSNHWFEGKYVPTTTIERYPLSVLKEAFQRSESLLTQATIDSKRVDKIAQSVFLGVKALLDIPKVALVNGVLYGVGGRHRTMAISQAIKALGAESIDQMIPCVTVVLDREQLLVAIEADNASRTMSPVEKNSLAAQAVGYRPGQEQLPDVKRPNQIFRVYRQHILDALSEPVMANWSMYEASGKLPLSAGAKLTLATALAKFIMFREVPRPRPLTVSAEVLRELGDDIDEETATSTLVELRDKTYPIPDKVSCHLSLDDLYELTSDAVQFIHEYFGTVILESSLVARAVSKTPFLYDFVMRFGDRKVEWTEDSTTHEATLTEYLDELNVARLQERESAKTSKRQKKGVDGQALFKQLNLLESVESLEPEAKQRMLDELTQKLQAAYNE